MLILLRFTFQTGLKGISAPCDGTRTLPLFLLFFQHTYANGTGRISGRLGKSLRNRFDLFTGRFDGKLKQKIRIKMQKFFLFFKKFPRQKNTPYISFFHPKIGYRVGEKVVKFCENFSEISLSRKVRWSS